MRAKARRTLFQPAQMHESAPYRPAPMSTVKDRMPSADGGDSDTDLLMALLSLQRVDGGFELDTATLRKLGIEPAFIAAAAKDLPGDRKTTLRALHTAIVLAVLETRFVDARDTWFAAVRKSRAWLKQAAGGWGPAIKGKSVDDWAMQTAAVKA
jgi:hypothetical protein